MPTNNEYDLSLELKRLKELAKTSPSIAAIGQASLDILDNTTQ